MNWIAVRYAWIVAALCWATAASALTPEQEADVFAEKGKKLTEGKDFAKAADHFRRAFAVYPDSKHAWNAARVLELAGDFGEAHLWYVQSHATAQTVEKRAKVTEALGMLEAKLLRSGRGRIEVVPTPAEARVRVNDVAVPALDGRFVRWTAAGDQQVAADAPACQTETTAVTVVAGATARWAPVLKALPAVVPAAAGPSVDIAKPAAPPQRTPWLAVAASGAGAIGLGLGGWWLWDGANAKAAANGKPIANDADVAAYKQAAANANATHSRGLITAAAGGVAAVAAAWLWLSEPAALVATPMLSADGLGVALLGRF